MKTLRIATRSSKLALWQANFVAEQIRQQHSDLHVKLVPVKTTGDRVQDKTLADIGGKGLFIKELESALLADEADIAVHSMKDVPPELPEQLCIAAILPREDARDVLLSEKYNSFSELPANAIVGTCSPRRTAQLLSYRPDLTIKMLRGNVDTRLRKLAQGEYDAIVLAAAGLKRLGLAEKITEYFSLDFMLPSVAQGAIGIECKHGDDFAMKTVAVLNDPATQLCVNVERDLVRALNGNCHSPIGSHAILNDDELCLMGLVQTTEGEVVRQQMSVAVDKANHLGKQLAQNLSARNIRC